MKKNQFFAQSYSDALSDFVYSCENMNPNRWDWIVLTAANERQAESYRIQIAVRAEQNRLPKGTEFIVIKDYNDQRAGSGGATLNVVRVLTDRLGEAGLLDKKILVIHSGGDSKRIPQYSACGKLFAPVPRVLPGGRVSAIFDELIIAAADIPGRCGKGMMVFPSDTELLFNSRQLDLLSCDAAGLSMKAPACVGQDHGVFLQGRECSDHRNHDVKKFLHKQSVDILNSLGAVDSSGRVDIDTGCIWLGTKLVKELYGLISEGGKYSQTKFEKFVNPKVCLNFYADFVYPLAADSTEGEFYQEMPENGFSDELKDCRRIIFGRFHKYRMSLVRLVPARYIHFGTTHEMGGLLVRDIKKYEYLGWTRRIHTNATSGTGINSYITENSRIPDSAYIEDSVVENSVVGENCIVSSVELKDAVVPAGIVLHGLKLENGKYVCRIYGRQDNPKGSQNAEFLGRSVSEFVRNSGIPEEKIWGRESASIWNARIYPECDTMEEAVRAALLIYRIISGTADQNEISLAGNSVRHSLNSSYSGADVSFAMHRKEEIQNKVKTETFVKMLADGEDMAKAVRYLSPSGNDTRLYLARISRIASQSPFPQKMRLFLACADLCRESGINDQVDSYTNYEELAYRAVSDTITEATFSRFKTDYALLSIVRDSVMEELPVRVNFCGSPSDAAPYCLEHGGTMLDGTILLKGKKPVRVTVNRLSEHVIRFGSLDQGCKDTFNDIGDVRSCSDPSDPYALHKAVLVAAGVVPLDVAGLTMETFCDHIGGGLEIITEADVPRGSGLGTSSIIAAAAVKAINRIFGMEAPDERIYAQVFLAEQLMNTGGGWQDQVGGLTGGIKYFTTLPGAYQDIKVEVLELPDSTLKELNDRFALIFSGQRRLARNVLREEMNQTIRNNKAALDALRQIQEYCALMKYYLCKGDITAFAKYITGQFELVKMLDKGASNTCIEYIFDVCDDLVDGKAICGAGGGGFLQVVLKAGVTKDELKQRLEENFADCGVEIWDCEFI